MAPGSEYQLTMTPAERTRASILIVESEANDRNNMRSLIKTLGYGGVSDAPNHSAALERLTQRKFSHIIFEAKKTTMPPREFLQKVLEADPLAVAIPSSYEPSVDEVFDLLIMGARGFLVKPFTSDTLEQAIINASKGEPIASAVVNAKDRNEALVAILMTSLDKVATIMRQALQFDTAKRELPRAFAQLKSSAELARMFCKGGEDGMINAIEKFCIDRSNGPATRLGRLRRKLRTTRDPAEDEAAESKGDS